jgi:hypothetical protein
MSAGWSCCLWEVLHLELACDLDGGEGGMEVLFVVGLCVELLG